MPQEAYKLRTCYVNGAEHLQNAWNVNFMYPGAPNQWSEGDWTAFLAELKAFGYNCFQIWIPPTLLVPGEKRENAAKLIKKLMEMTKSMDMMFNPFICVNSYGADWYFACPNDAGDKKIIMEFWDFYAGKLAGADIFTIFPGDIGGCNRNGCDHDTFLDLCGELIAKIKGHSPSTAVEIGTWGSPFAGWGSDMRHVPNWDGSWNMITDPKLNSAESPAYIFNGSPKRVAECMKSLISRLDAYPVDTIVSINLGFNGISEPEGKLFSKLANPPFAYDGRPWAKKIAEKRRITSWDYALAEGELIAYPHWRLPNIKRKRLMEREAAPYFGAVNYTMTPKLNMLSLYAVGQLMINPERDPDEIASEFTGLVFGDPKIGTLMEAFEIVGGWGHYPRRLYTKNELQKDFTELAGRLEACKGAKCELPLFPDSETHRRDLLWHAKNFLELTGKYPDRGAIKKKYWEKSLSIYDAIPMSIDERADSAAYGYSQIGSDIGE